MHRKLFLVFTVGLGLQGQQFDVASVRPHAPEDSRFLVRPPNRGRFTAVGIGGKLLVMLAYGVQDSQIKGGPGWFTSEKWDIEAKCEEDSASADQTAQMLGSLLEERFGLKVHKETEQRPVYVLSVTSGGPKFKESEKKTTNLRVSSNAISMESGSIARMLPALATALGRPVIDGTHLTGLYDLSLRWDDAPVREGGLPGATVQEGPPGGGHGSIFTAVQDQLGLQLKPQRAPIEVIVVDRMVRPSAN
ncbi:MAG: TIGR03435 family protein [Acidobacteria bacterium]|nr:TIGR03435 family protein [Acidobacteriota bacterium]